MEYELYIDAFAASGFVMDLLTLMLVNGILKRNRGLRRLVLSGMFGTVLSVGLFLVLKDYMLYTLLIHFAVNPAMVYFALRASSWRHFVADWGVSYLVLLLLGGVMQWVNQTVFHGKYFMAAVLLGAFVVMSAYAVWKRLAVPGQHVYAVKLIIEGTVYELSAYYDSGNLLMDPYFQQPVSIVAEKRVEEALKDKPGRLITYSSLGTENGFLTAYTTEKMLIYKGKREICIEPAIIAPAREELFAGEDYRMILNGHLL